MKHDRKKIHEKYHTQTSSQKKKIRRNNFTYRILIEKIEKYLSKKMKVLDIGCGAGTLDFYLANKVKDIQGVDISKKAIDSCNATKENLEIKNVNFKVCFFPSENVKGKFDLVIFTEIIEHLEDDMKALREINKLLNKKGILFLSTPSSNSPLHRLGLAKDFDKRVGHVRRYDLHELLDLIQKNGFKIKEVNKTEGILRNFLYVNQPAGKLVKFLKYFMSDIYTFVDNLTIPVFGESNFIIVAEKV